MKAQITQSKIDDRGVVVEWNDGQFAIFDTNGNLTGGNLQKNRELVSKLSAECTLNGCGVAK